MTLADWLWRGNSLDDATVEIETIAKPGPGQGDEDGNFDGARRLLSAFVSTICICGRVQCPCFSLTGVAKFLFVPLAKPSSRHAWPLIFFRGTLIPTLVMYISVDMNIRRADRKVFMGRFQRGFEAGFDKFRGGYYQLWKHQSSTACAFASVFVAFCLLSLGLGVLPGRGLLPPR